MWHAAEPIVACLQKTRGEGESSTPAEAEDTVKRDERRTEGQVERARKEGASERLGRGCGGNTRVDGWRYYNVYYSRIHPSSFNLGKGKAHTFIRYMYSSASN